MALKFDDFSLFALSRFTWDTAGVAVEDLWIDRFVKPLARRSGTSGVCIPVLGETWFLEEVIT